MRGSCGRPPRAAPATGRGSRRGPSSAHPGKMVRDRTRGRSPDGFRSAIASQFVFEPGVRVPPRPWPPPTEQPRKLLVQRCDNKLPVALIEADENELVDLDADIAADGHRQSPSSDADSGR